MLSSLKKMLASVLFVSLICVYLSACAAKTANDPLEQASVDYQIFTLDNGLTTIVHTDHSVPNVYVGVWYRVGSKDEPPGKTGFAHLFEHLMFQETANRKGEYFTPFDAVGAVGMNGTTNVDRTNYYETVPSNALDLALWMESDRMGYLGAGITQKLLDEQRAVVKNEKRQGQLSPGAEGLDRFVSIFYPKNHPYGHTTIGSMEDLDNASLADVKQWFKDNYGASNAVLVLSGDVDLATAKQKVAHYFSDVPAGKPSAQVEQWIPKLPHIQRDVIYGKVGNVSIGRTWSLPGSRAKDTNLMEVVGATLAGSPSAPLTKLLVDDLQLATAVQAGVITHQINSTFAINVALKPGASIDRVNKAIDQVLQQYFAEGPDEKRLQQLTLATNISMLRSLESNAAVGQQLISNYVLNGDALFFNQQRKWLVETTPTEIKQLAQKWLAQPYFESRMLPLPKTKPMADEVDRSRIPEPGSFKGQVKFPPIKETTLANGMKVVVAERHNLPLVDMDLQFNTGSMAEQPYGDGIADYVFDLMASGTQDFDMSELSDKMDNIGMSLHANSSQFSSNVAWGVLDKYLDASFALAADMVRHPNYPQKEVDKLKGNIATSYDAYEQNPMKAANSIYANAIWGENHPLGRIASREEALHFTRDTLVQFHQQEVGPDNATLFMIGDITLDKAKALAEHYFGDWQPVGVKPVNTVPVAQGQPGRVILVNAPGAVQSSISVGHVVSPFDKDRAATDLLMNSALGGSFHSRLNMDLREDKGWAYGFGSGLSHAAHGQRVFTASGTVQTDKTAASMLEIQKIITSYVDNKPITAAELQRDQTSLIHAIPNTYTNSGAFLSSMVSAATYGLPYDRAEGAAARIAKVNLDAVRQDAKTTFRPDRLTWVVVGDLEKIEQNIRALHLGPVEIWDIYGHKLR